MFFIVIKKDVDLNWQLANGEQFDLFSNAELSLEQPMEMMMFC